MPERPKPENNETREKAVEQRVVELLIAKHIITSVEAISIDTQRLDELMVRTAHDFKELPKIIPEANIEKVRKILGLTPKAGEGTVDTILRDTEIAGITQEMRTYLEGLKTEYPEVVGMILCGSRMDHKKMPSLHSDIDIVIILKQRLVTDPKTEDGNGLIEIMRAYTDRNQTKTGIPVELDELYTADDLLKILKSKDDKGKLIWGWNPEAVKYIGDAIENMSEANVQTNLLQDLTSHEVQIQKQQIIDKAKKQISEYLIAEEKINKPNLPS